MEIASETKNLLFPVRSNLYAIDWCTTVECVIVIENSKRPTSQESIMHMHLRVRENDVRRCNPLL